MGSRTRILVLGMTAGGATSLPAPLLERIMSADLLVGGVRQLGYFAESRAETLAIRADVAPAIERLQLALERGEQAVVLASGDPLWYGIGTSLRRSFPHEALEIVPAPTAAQLAFAALAEPWDGAALLSAHGRPLADIVGAALAARRAAILTDNEQTPAVVARALMAAGLAPQTPCAICENLGGPAQRVLATDLQGAAVGEYAALNVFVLLQPAPAPLAPQPPGLPDEAFSTQNNLITKREVRLLTLAELALGPGEVLWDIGTGSGSLAIEAARAQPSARVFSVERRAVMCQHARENLRRFPAPNLSLFEGAAPDTCIGWPDPNAVFVGGSGSQMEAIVALARARLRPGGRLVINLATFENLTQLRALLPDAHVAQVQISRAVPVLDMTRLEALNPVFMATWRANSGAEPSI